VREEESRTALFILAKNLSQPVSNLTNSRIGLNGSEDRWEQVLLSGGYFLNLVQRIPYLVERSFPLNFFQGGDLVAFA
jgi:hypothetical protein